MSQRSEIFGRLLKGAINAIAAYEGKAAPAIETDLGAQIGIAGASIQRYKAGHIPPEPRTVQILATAGVQRGFLARAWLVRFLQAARYPAPALLIAQLIDGDGADAVRSSGLPSGMIALLFTDIVGSSTQWEQHPKAMEQALARHDAVLHQAIDAYGGQIFKMVGDACHAVFTTVPAALEAALAAQRALLAEPWGPIDLRVRMAIHVGAPQQRDGDYFGPPLNRAARLRDVGHGGQLLLSLSAHELLHDTLPPGVSLIDLGEHQLRDLGRPERIFQAAAPDLPTTFPPLSSLQRYRHNLPSQATALIGREDELEVVASTLRDPSTRLLTLTGPGGIGKTRLALQAASALLDEFADGVWFVGLAPITDPGLVLPTIAYILGVREQSGQVLMTLLQNYLREKAVLLVLDNVEQVRAAAPEIAALLAAAPESKVLATSREPLHLYGEREYAVPALSLPARRPLPPLERLTQYEAVRLFIERATAVRPELLVNVDTAPIIAEICHRLDGLPLAIELAAARSKVFAPQAILSRLDRRLATLTGGARDLPARQQTLRGAIDWSYQLLDAIEQECFARLGVFAGGCTLASAAAVFAAGGDVLLDAETGLSSLLDKSLVQQRAGDGTEPRFVLLETIREYAQERLAAADAEPAVRHAHAVYYRDLAAQAAEGLRGPDEFAWVATLDREHDNLRAALEWAADHAPAMAAQIAASLWHFWEVHCLWSEGATWTARALDRIGGQAETSRITLLAAAGSLAMIHGDHEAARRHLAEGLAAAQAADDLVAEADVRIASTWSVFFHGDHTGWAELAVAAVDVARRSGDAGRLADALQARAWQCFLSGDVATAQAADEESLAIANRLGNPSLRASALGQLGWIAHGRGDYVQAQRYAEQSLPIYEAQNNPASISVSYNLLGVVCQAQGSYDEALDNFMRALELRHLYGDRRGCIAVYSNLADLHRVAGNLPDAASACSVILRLSSEIDYPSGYEWGFSETAMLLTAAHPEQAARFFGAAEQVRTAAALADWPGWGSSAAAIDRVRAALGETAFAAAFDAGRALAREVAVAEALAQLTMFTVGQTLRHTL